ncbi:MAG: dihydroneopterin aldolase [Chitinophagaceae bacterium]|nr:MAG: dihydroneopterin aldolase [Chitinophagaceae bacterium]
MASHFTIQLSNLRFYAPHGLFAEEALAGNAFEVNLSLTTEAPSKTVTSIEQTINYAEVYCITKTIFEERRDLLETLAMEIAGALKQSFPLLQKITVQIIKLNPPIAAFTGSVSVTYSKDFTT